VIDPLGPRQGSDSETAVDGGVLSIRLVAPPGEIGAWSLIAQPVLDSIRIGD